MGCFKGLRRDQCRGLGFMTQDGVSDLERRFYGELPFVVPVLPSYTSYSQYPPYNPYGSRLYNMSLDPNPKKSMSLAFQAPTP